MAYIFMDESGDLGFGERSSKWFLITIIVVDDDRTLERVVKKVWKSLRKKHKHIGELHASKEKAATCRKMLTLLAELDGVKILTAVLNKDKVYIAQRQQKDSLYFFVANMVLDGLYNNALITAGGTIHIVADRKDTKKSLQDNFVGLLEESLNTAYPGKHSVTLCASHESKSLQAVDFVSWALFQKYQHGDYSFYEIIRDCIVDERVVFP